MGLNPFDDIPRLTAPEVRRLLEGKRVKNEMEHMAREQNRHGDRDDLRGRVVPRESDEALLADYADRMERGEVGENAMSLGGT